MRPEPLIRVAIALFAIVLAAAAPDACASNLRFDLHTVHVGSANRELETGHLQCDLDGNGKVDLVSATSSYDTALIASEGTGVEGQLARRVLAVEPGYVVAVGGICHGPGDARIVLVTNSATVVYGGNPLRVQARFPSIGFFYDRVEIADADGDGTEEIVAGSYGTIVMYDLATGLEKKRFNNVYATRWTLAQLDADPALEFLIPGTPPYQIDGATGAIEWTGTGMSCNEIALGNLDADPAPEVVCMPYQQLEAYKLHQTTPLWSTFITYGDYLAALDVRGDARAEILVSARGDVRIFDPGTHAVVASHTNGNDYEYVGFVAGDLDGDGERELAFQADSGASGWDSVVIIDGDDGALENRIVTEVNYGRGGVHDDVDADGADEVVYAEALQSGAGGIFDGGGYGVLDPRTGLDEYATRLPQFQYAPINDFQVAQLDADAAHEIVVTGQGGLDVYDGATHELESHVTMASGDSPIRFEFAGAAATPTAQVYIGTSGPRIGLYDFPSGAQRFRSPVMSGSSLTFIGQHDMDGDGIPELVCGTETGLWVWDRDTHVLENSLPGSGNGYDEVATAAGPKVGVSAGSDGFISVFDPATFGSLRRIDLGAAVNAVAAIPDHPDLVLAFASNGVAVVDLATDTILLRSPSLGSRIARGNQVAVTPVAGSGGDAYRIAFGSDLAAFELILSGLEIRFADGFE